MTDSKQSTEPSGKTSASVANITDQERDWAQQALAEYEQKNYKCCLQHLERIGEARTDDPKVLLNKAIVEFYDSGLCTTDKFQKSLIDVCKQVSDGGLPTDRHPTSVLRHSITLPVRRSN